MQNERLSVNLPEPQKNKSFIYRHLRLLVILIGVIALDIVLGCKVFPEYAIRLIVFGFVVLLDLLYMPVFISVFRFKNEQSEKCVKILYLIPIIFFTVFIVAVFFRPIHSWEAFYRIYFVGIIVLMFIWKFILIAFMLVADIISFFVNFNRWGKNIFAKKRKAWLRIRGFIRIGIITASVFVLLLFVGFFAWIYHFKTLHVEIQDKELPQSFNGFKVVQISDMHLGSWLHKSTLQRAVNQINDLNPDVILFTGDMVNFSTSEVLPFVDELKQMHASKGIYCVLGNHDYGNYIEWDSREAKEANLVMLADMYKLLGWKLLRNENEILRMGNDSIAILGVENWSKHKAFGRHANLAIANHGVENIAFKILLTHDPSHWRNEVIKSFKDINITFSGHTHAMQMGYECGKYRFSPAQWMYPEWGGVYSSTDTSNIQYLYVNRGLGHVGLPTRIGIRPEITEIVFNR